MAEFWSINTLANGGISVGSSTTAGTTSMTVSSTAGLAVGHDHCRSKRGRGRNHHGNFWEYGYAFRYGRAFQLC